MDEAALTRSLRTGDEDAAGTLFDRFGSTLYHYCLTLLPDAELAGDALCNALVAAVDQAGRLRSPERLELWLYALARNEALRIQARREHSSRASEAADASRDPQEDRLREVHELIHWHGLNDRGVAVVLGISLLRARRLAQRAEGADFDDDPGRDGRRTAPLPSKLRDRVLTDAANPGRAAYRGEQAGPLRRSGFPIALDQVAYRRNRMMVAASVAGIVAIAVLLSLPVDTDPDVELSVGRPQAEQTAAEQPLTAEPVPTGSTSVSPTASPSATPSPSPTKRAPAAKPPAARPPAPWPVPSYPAPYRPVPRAPAPPTGAIVGIWNACIEVRGTSWGSDIDLLRCDGTAYQQWTVAYDGTIRAFGMCMDVTSSGTEDGTDVQLWECNGTGAQQWRTGPNGSLVNPRSGKCLDGPNIPENDPRLEIWHCTGGEYQRWRLPR